MGLFIDRERELEVLEQAYRSPRPELVIVYGRRRVGKTYLVKRFLRGKEGIYLVVQYADRDLCLRDLSKQVSEYVGASLSFEWLRDLLIFVVRWLGSRCSRPLVVIDEFQRLVGTGLLAELQSLWDSYSLGNAMLILLGSGVGVVQKLVLSYESPLYGRATHVLRLEPFGYREARIFMKKWSAEDRVRGYAVFGGTPAYLALIDDNLGLLENIEKLVLSPGARLLEEPLNLVSVETREPDRYLAILEAIACGAHRPFEIASRTGIAMDSLRKYLRVLEQGLALVVRSYPLGMELKPRYVRYEIADNFFHFWFAEIYPRRRMIELGMHREVLSKIARNLDNYAARVWERIAFEHMALLSRVGKVRATSMGRWWWRGTEIDLVVLDEDSSTTYFVECVWGCATRRDLINLIEKARAFPWRKGSRKEIFVIYAKEVDGLEERENEVLVYTLDRVEKDFDAYTPRIETI